jgi:hypothetical protein
MTADTTGTTRSTALAARARTTSAAADPAPGTGVPTARAR